MRFSGKNPFVLLFLFIFIWTAPKTYATDSSTIRVACILDHGYFVMEENGGLSGYSYDYLKKVAQYTGWDYEFIFIEEESTALSEAKAMEMLENGELDLLGNIFKTEEMEARFEFPSLPTGISRYNLVSLVNNYKISQDNYFLHENLRVALVEDAAINQRMLTFFQELNLNVTITYVPTHEDAMALMVAEEVDTIIVHDSSADSWMLNTLTTIDRFPFYFVAEKGNEDLVADLSGAIANINVQEPDVHQTLLSEYFSALHQGPIILTQEEEAALADYSYLTVGLLKGREPYQFFNGDEEEVPQGISVEILEEISRIIGMEFRYVWLESREEMRDKIASQEIDICSTVPYDSDYELTYYFDVILTKPYATNAVVWLHHSGENREENPLFYYLADNIPLFPDEQLTEIFDFESALLNLSQNGGASIFSDPYMAQYLIQKLNITNVEMQTISTVSSDICLGIGKHLDPNVVGLINHAFLHLDPYVVDEIIYDNVTVQGGLTVEALLREHADEILFLVSISLLSLVLFLIRHASKLKKITQEDSLTKLFNAGYFHEYAGEKAKKLEIGCLILIDIDYFKSINDTYGHQEGDNILKKVSQTLKEHFRSDDIVARLGGDEFIILLEYKPEIAVLEERCGKILATLNHKDCKIPVTLSIGGYIFTKQTNYKDLYHAADKVLYEVKERGRNGFSFSE